MNNVCGYTDLKSGAGDKFLSVFKLRTLALLWCDGRIEEKTEDLYNFCAFSKSHDVSEAGVACNNREFR